MRGSREAPIGASRARSAGSTGNQCACLPHTQLIHSSAHIKYTSKRATGPPPRRTRQALNHAELSDRPRLLDQQPFRTLRDRPLLYDTHLRCQPFPRGAQSGAQSVGRRWPDRPTLLFDRNLWGSNSECRFAPPGVETVRTEDEIENCRVRRRYTRVHTAHLRGTATGGCWILY